jgi:hypothetical protein
MPSILEQNDMVHHCHDDAFFFGGGSLVGRRERESKKLQLHPLIRPLWKAYNLSTLTILI